MYNSYAYIQWYYESIFLSLFASVYDCRVNFSFKFGTQFRRKAVKGFWNHSSDLAKGALTFSIQTNEMPEQTLNVSAFERILIWLN